MNWWKELRGNVRLREPLKRHTTFKIGGPARIFIEPQDSDDLKLLLILLKKHKIPSFLIGAGSNLLISDAGLDAAVFRLSAPYFQTVTFNGEFIDAGAGASLARVIRACAKQSLAGAEFLTGIPGTVGGALAMNAGQAGYGKSIADLVESVTVIDRNGKIKRLEKNRIKFGYRASSLSKYIIINARLKLTSGRPVEIASRINKYIALRRSTQDYSGPSCGCIFKNPAGRPAGKLIDLCGLKGKSVGDAAVSFRHANFIINKGKAKAQDVLRLMDIINREVKKKFNINLKPEVIIWKRKSSAG